MFAWEGCDVTAVLVGNRDHCTPETAHQIEQLKNTGAQFKEQFEQEAFESEPYTLIIDAIFGVGLCREVGGDVYKRQKSLTVNFRTHIVRHW